MFEDFILDVGKEVGREVRGEDRGAIIWFWVSLIFLVGAFVVMGYPMTIISMLVSLGLVALFIKYHRLGLYLLILAAPFIGLMVHVPTGELGIVSEFFSGSADFALVDGIAIVLFLAWLIKSIYLWKIRGFDRWQIYFPGAIFFSAFIGVALLSVFMAGEDWQQSFKYCVRPIMFFYLVFLVLPYNLIRSKIELRRVFQIFYGAGIFSAFLGLISLFILPTAGILTRAAPIAFWGISPLGENHNLLAEVLIAALPIGMILFHNSKTKWSSLGLALGNGLIFVIALLTFARTAWIAILFMAIVYFALIYQKKLVKISKYILVLILLLAPVIVYMYIFSTSYVALSSTEARLMLSEIAVQMFSASPVLGQGAGMFMNYVGATNLFTFEFGQPMEAHGVLQKVMGEMGLAGLIALASMFGYVIVRLAKSFKNLPWASQGKYIVALSLVMAVGSICYQLFNTNYYNSKLWIPLALALAAAKVFKHEERLGVKKKNARKKI